MNEEIREKYMREALVEAEKALEYDEVPVGAVVVKNDRIVARAFDLRDSRKDPTAHAEILALRQAAKNLGDWRLNDCELYVTLEPCPMCAGAAIQARIKTLIFGAPNLKAGAVITHCHSLSIPSFNHKVAVISRVLEQQCAELLSRYFQSKRGRSNSQ